jgi:hypothetical protein
VGKEFTLLGPLLMMTTIIGHQVHFHGSAILQGFHPDRNIQANTLEFSNQDLK